jgi:hypothetical protein
MRSNPTTHKVVIITITAEAMKTDKMLIFASSQEVVV